MKGLETALKLSFIADALAMPAHWFYDRYKLKQAFPEGLKQFYAPPEYHPNSIMNLHSTSSGGRGSQSGEVIGKLILKGKEKYWGVPDTHYHKGLRPGDNTLNLHCLRVLMRHTAENGKYDPEGYLDSYISFMTSTSVDTYAESYHRAFFQNLSNAKPPTRCAGVTHDTASIGGLIQIGLLAALTDKSTCKKHLYLTHPSEELAVVCELYVDIIKKLLEDPGSKLPESPYRDRTPENVIGPIYSTACYISDAWPSVLYLASRFRDEPTKALAVNAELGGDNCHRGAVLGFILGLANPDADTTMFGQLTAAREIQKEIDDCLRYSP